MEAGKGAGGGAVGSMPEEMAWRVSRSRERSQPQGEKGRDRKCEECLRMEGGKPQEAQSRWP